MRALSARCLLIAIVSAALLSAAIASGSGAAFGARKQHASEAPTSNQAAGETKPRRQRHRSSSDRAGQSPAEQQIDSKHTPKPSRSERNQARREAAAQKRAVREEQRNQRRQQRAAQRERRSEQREALQQQKAQARENRRQARQPQRETDNAAQRAPDRVQAQQSPSPQAQSPASEPAPTTKPGSGHKRGSRPSHTRGSGGSKSPKAGFAAGRAHSSASEAQASKAGGAGARTSAISSRGAGAGNSPIASAQKPVSDTGNRTTIVERVVREIPSEYRLAIGFLGALVLLLSGVTMRERHRSVRTERDMLVDGLTGVGSRRALERQLAAEWKRAQRHGRPLGLVLLDLDDLKEINDAFGHAAGDELLRSAGRSIEQRVRESDMVARLGGDEFVVIAPETSTEGLEQLAHALQNDFRRLKVGVSVGFAARIDQDGSPQDLMARADSAMYADKHARVV